MKYVSVRNPGQAYSFKEAVLQNLSPDGSLFIPRNLPVLDKTQFEQVDMSIHKAAFNILQHFVQPDLNEEQLRKIVARTFSFPIPIKQIGNTGIHVEELFHGPTFAFKDIGARFIAGCLEQFKSEHQKITVLVATSGDTGGAVANAFYGIDGISVVVLYPKNKISAFQEHQIAGLGKNVQAIAVDGTFDDCQNLVKQAFADKELADAMTLTSANSINVARWLPQMIFYAIAWNHMVRSKQPLNIVVPSGNYGNIAASLLLHNMGLHFEKIIAAHNENDTIPRWLMTGMYLPHDTIPTFANAMDVSDPSNFVRFQYYQNESLKGKPFQFAAASVSNAEILNTIRDCWDQYDYLLDPHSATAYHSMVQNGLQGIMMATAHPYKFKDVIEKAIGEFPGQSKLDEPNSEINTLHMPTNYARLKTHLLSSL